MKLIKRFFDKGRQQEALTSTPAINEQEAIPETVDSAAIAGMRLIMDIGMNNGRDSLFYLRKGFRVVAVEANPILVEKAQRHLRRYIDSGQLIIEPTGLAKERGQFTFFLNLDNDHWSSFDKDWGTRDQSRYQELPVSCIQPQALFEKHGIPYYLKVDIEGFDIEVVRALRDFSARPRYISIEENQVYYFAELWCVGCRSFKIIDQNNLWQFKCPQPPLEGNYVEGVFDGTNSGPFGEETPGEWLSLDQALEQYLTRVRSPTRGFLAKDSWFDIHGRVEVG